MGHLANLGSSVGALMPLVLNLRNPSQIRERRVLGAPVQMRALETARARTSERLKNDQVNAFNHSASFVAKRDGWVSTASVWGEAALCPDAPYPPSVRNLINPFKAGDDFPFFHSNDASKYRLRKQGREPDKLQRTNP